MLHISLIKTGILNIPKKVISIKDKWAEEKVRPVLQDETWIGWVSYVLLQAFLIFFGLYLLDWFVFYNIPYLLCAWMRCMSLVCLFAFLIFSGSDLLDIRASSNEYLHIKKSLTFLIFFLCVLIAAYNMKSAFFDGDMLVSGALSWGYAFVSAMAVGLFLYYKHKWGYTHLWFKALTAPVLVWGAYIIYSLSRIWF